jgi:phosphoribosylglycinamide formyltransferase-1
MSDAERLRVGVLVSGRGSNLQALVEATRSGGVPATVVVVIADREAPALAWARGQGIEAVLVDPRQHPSREAHDKAVSGVLEARGVGLVCLAGYLRVLGPGFVRQWAGRLLNVHPALLPAFPGLHAQRQALAYGVRVSGATVHFVDEGVDTGPVVLQAAVPVEPDDTEATLAERILREEHRIYPEAVRLFAEGRLALEGRRVLIRPAAGGAR